MIINMNQKNPPVSGGVQANGPSPAQEGGRSFGEIFGEMLAGDRLSDTIITGTKRADFAFGKAGPAEAGKPDAVNAAKMHKRVEAAVKWLANYLGIKPGLLLAVFDELGINPEDMADPTKFMDIVDKIAGYFKLDEDKRKEITRELGGILGFVF